MEAQPSFAWTAIYEELADALLRYRRDRHALIGKLVDAFDARGLKLPKLDHDGVPEDVDPFTVFGLFNKHQSNESRIRILGALAESFGLSSAVPSSFDGVPLLSNLNATFYRFSNDPDRGERDIDYLWDAFEAALAYADSPSDVSLAAFADAYDRARLLKGNNVKLTMGLFWIRPFTYLSLDSRSCWYIDTLGIVDVETANSVVGKNGLGDMADIPAAEKYHILCERIKDSLDCASCEYRSLPELSCAAFRVSEKVNKEKKEAAPDADSEASGMSLGKESMIGPVAPDSMEVKESDRAVRYWLYSPGHGAYRWNDLYNQQAMTIGWGWLGDLSGYRDKEALRRALCEGSDDGGAHTNDTLTTWQFAHELKPGDIVYAKKGLTEVVGRGVVTGEYEYHPDADDEFVNRRAVRWTHKGCWEYPVGKVAAKTLTDVTGRAELIDKLEALFDGLASCRVPGAEPPSRYTKEDFLSEVFMDEPALDTLIALARRKKNVILQGAPGTGKTYCAKRLAYALMGERDRDRLCMVQFHQSYAYEDFIEGFRPTDTGFELRKGSFYTFCKRAAADRSRDYAFIIDEINRGNLSKILGELFMLIESDKRGESLRLLYSDEEFSVPGNVYIIGTMNTADRGIAMMDYALRRRFAFFDLEPGFSSEAFGRYRAELGSPVFDALVSRIESLNGRIRDDEALGDGFAIGHSFLSNLEPCEADSASLRRIVDYEIAPLLREYWFDESGEADRWIANLRRALG